MKVKRSLVLDVAAMIVAGILFAVIFGSGGGPKSSPVEADTLTVVSPPAALSVRCGDSETDHDCRARLVELIHTINMEVGSGG